MMIAGMMGLVMVGIIGLLVVVARIVYKDAKLHDMNAAAWTAVVVLLPNLIGLIIYLIVRQSADKVYRCSECNNKVKKDYPICPQCKSSLENLCSECHHVVTEDMVYCPYCGVEVAAHSVVKTASKTVQKVTIIKPLIGVGVGYIALFCVGVVVITIASWNEQSSLGIMHVEMSTPNRMQSSFHYYRGDDRMQVVIDEAGEALLGIHMEIEKGTIDLIVEDEEGTIVFSERYRVGVHEEQVQLVGAKGDRYKVELFVDGAKGSYKIMNVK